MTTSVNATGNDLLRELGIDALHSGAYAGKWLKTTGDELESRNPATGELLGRVRLASAKEYDALQQEYQLLIVLVINRIMHCR